MEFALPSSMSMYLDSLGQRSMTLDEIDFENNNETINNENDLTVVPALLMPFPTDHTVTMSGHLAQLSAKQDDYRTGTSVMETSPGVMEVFEFAVTWDGHGGDDCIERLRAIPQNHLEHFVALENPVEGFAAYLDSMPMPTERSSGSTMCLARIFGDRVEIINCGDSRAMVFKNGELTFFTVEHNWTNPAERKRVEEMGARFSPDQSFELVHETCMKGAYAERAYFNPLVKLATTQALGHHRSTGYAPDTTVIPYSRGDRLRIVMGSDGLWDMVMEDSPADKQFLMTQSGEQIMDRFKTRWLQKWEMHSTNRVTGLQDIGFYAFTEKQCDDITVVAIDIAPTRP